jgi:hypothetical protein
MFTMLVLKTSEVCCSNKLGCARVIFLLYDALDESLADIALD